MASRKAKKRASVLAFRPSKATCAYPVSPGVMLVAHLTLVQLDGEMGLAQGRQSAIRAFALNIGAGMKISRDACLKEQAFEGGDIGVAGGKRLTHAPGVAANWPEPAAQIH